MRQTKRAPTRLPELGRTLRRTCDDNFLYFLFFFFFFTALSRRVVGHTSYPKTHNIRVVFNENIDFSYSARRMHTRVYTRII